MYKFREVTLRNGVHKRKTLVIDFDDPTMAIVGEFLMADATLLSGEVLVDIDYVLLGEQEVISVSGNRCALEIKANNTIITDLFADMEGIKAYDAYQINTKELRRLIVMWLDKLLEFQNENE